MGHLRRAKGHRHKERLSVPQSGRDDLLHIPARADEIVDTNLDWFVRCQPQKSNYVGRFAAEDHSWYIHHGFASQLLEMERSVWRKTQADWVFLCCYDLQLVPDEYLDRIIEPHSYVVLDDPCRLYRAPDG